MNNPKIGLCLSGGGFRAIAYHLGCLRGLRKLGLLEKVSYISCVSGGAVIGTIYSLCKTYRFSEFEKKIEHILLSGLDIKIFGNYILTGRCIADAIQVTVGEMVEVAAPFFKSDFEYHRKFSPTESFVSVLKKVFGNRKLSDLDDSEIDLIINGTELRSNSAIRLSKKEAICWKFGRISPGDVGLAEAVAVSAAFPILLPALERTYSFDIDGKKEEICISMADGGIYDNLGLSPFLSTNDFPGAFKRPELDYIIACDAGNGQRRPNRLPHLAISRMNSAVKTLTVKSRTNNFTTLHHLKEQEKIRGFILAYLGQRDENLPEIPADFIPKSRVDYYPTNFSKMNIDDLNALSKRGEQLVELLARHYVQEIL